MDGKKASLLLTRNNNTNAKNGRNANAQKQTQNGGNQKYGNQNGGTKTGEPKRENKNKKTRKTR